MYLMYVDESGDTGLVNSPTRYFVLSGIVVHESNWRPFINALLQFRKTMRRVYGIPIRSEIHASEMIVHRPFNMARHQRLAVLRNAIDELVNMRFLSITNVVVDKQGKPATYNVFDAAWGTLFQRFENTMIYRNFPGSFLRSHGMVITDATAGQSLTRLVRRMAAYNYIPSSFGGPARNVPIQRIIEDPFEKNSSETLPIQACDVVAYFLKQRFAPCGYIRRQHATRYFDRLLPVLNRRASRTNPLGIVML